ncbi:hypothetical protein Y1Q_0008836 [Alligator mississippiensis]|uniref:Uncharacterized protein n=1 Tax=Alligator mississippiensis TaxID=8496 RepID=A0A151NAC4_ALLMI|nr:hypothetical protein Y1Q_0008836 [Alligator mississippiensis]
MARSREAGRGEAAGSPQLAALAVAGPWQHVATGSDVPRNSAEEGRSSLPFTLRNPNLGVSVVDQQRNFFKADQLLISPAAKKYYRDSFVF